VTKTRIRPAVASDRPALERFMTALREHERTMSPGLLRPGPEIAAQHVARLLETVATHGGVALIAADTETRDPLGFAIAHVWTDSGTLFDEPAQRMGRLDELYVAEAARGRGLGRALVEACEAHFKACGLTHMQLGVLAGNRSAQRVYEAAGYADWLHTMIRRIA
jgi:ribosomal protein S18 acetylase RimI-like enzyme